MLKLLTTPRTVCPLVSRSLFASKPSNISQLSRSFHTSQPQLSSEEGEMPTNAGNSTAKWLNSYQTKIGSTEKLNEWIVNISENPNNLTGEMVIAGLTGMLLHGMFAGQGSLSTATYWGLLLKPVEATDCIMLFTDLVALCNSGLVPREEEQSDTFYRALFFKNDPELDTFLNKYADDCFAGAAAIQSNDLSWRARFESIRSMYPQGAEAQALLRAPVHEWFIPVLDLSRFTEEVVHRSKNAPLHPFMFTANNFFQCFALQHSDLPTSSAEFEEDVAQVATAISASIVDSLWASYYVTQSLESLERIVFLASTALAYTRDEGKEGDLEKLLHMVATKCLDEDEPKEENNMQADENNGIDIGSAFSFDAQGTAIVSVGVSALVSLKKGQATMGMLKDHLDALSSNNSNNISGNEWL